MLRKVAAVISLLLSGAWWLGIGREFIKAYVFDRILHVLNPYIDVLTWERIFNYGPPLLLAIMGVYLLIRPRHLEAGAGINPNRIEETPFRVFFSTKTQSAIYIVLFVIVVSGVAWLTWTASPAPELPGNPALGNSDQILSRYDTLILKCRIPKKNEDQQAIAQSRRATQAIAEAMGYKVVFTDAEGSRKIEMVHTGTQLSLFDKWSLEAIRLDNNYIVVISKFDFGQSLLALFSMMRVDPNDPKMIENVRSIEKLIGIPAGRCQIM